MKANQYKHSVVKIRAFRHRGRLYMRTVDVTGIKSQWHQCWSYDGLTRRGTRNWLMRKASELRKIDRFDMRHPINPPEPQEGME